MRRFFLFVLLAISFAALATSSRIGPRDKLQNIDAMYDGKYNKKHSLHLAGQPQACNSLANDHRTKIKIKPSACTE
jgi:thioredoxin-related protein